jgi:sterol desaturase/sphingolipid hydroxylase (fatty acid hydroxylase superfamily)
MLKDLAFWQQWLFVYGLFIVRYALFAGILFSVFYVIWRQFWSKRRIQPNKPETREQIRREVRGSVVSLAIITGIIALTLYAWRLGYTQLYEPYDHYGAAWFWISIPICIVIHDTYFYWTHRLMHHPRLFKTVHYEHHRSTNPTPWAAFAFHPTEAVIEAGIMPLLAFALPLSPYAIVTMGMVQMAFNVMGHLGYEIFPKGATRHPVLGWLNTPTHHNQHHARFNANYGLYFNFWDWAMNTNHKAYHQEFDKVIGQS